LRDPISINGNSGFSSLDIPGSGTFEDPYLIKNYQISTIDGNLIDIQNTDAYVTVRDNILNGDDYSGSGITCVNVSHVTIDYNQISDVFFGIRLFDSSSNTISNNILQRIGVGSIQLYSSNNSLIVNNESYDNLGGGISVRNSMVNTISNNHCYNNRRGGIFINESTTLIISENHLHNNQYSGIPVRLSSEITITNNVIHGNSWKGISIDEADDNTITFNTISNNSEKGIWINGSNTMSSDNLVFDNIEEGIYLLKTSKNNDISKNDFTNNFIHNQGVDDGLGNSFSSNYWSEWMGVGVYNISGTANNYDPNPQTKSNHFVISGLTIIPNENNVIFGSVTIEWFAEIGEIIKKPVTYYIYYLKSDEPTWMKIVSKVNVTSYTWDTTTVEDESYFIKVIGNGSGVINMEIISDSIFVVQNKVSSKNNLIPKVNIHFDVFAVFFGLNTTMMILLKRRSHKR
jgi:parallel beta-helix repeat protein